MQIRRRSPRLLRRRGVAVILVLGILAVTLALSYALVRSQTQTQLVQDNFTRQNDARNAAQIGMARAMQEMTTSSWAGVATPVTGSVDSDTSYTVTYTAGDSTLTSSSAAWSEYPFRVTLTSVGRAVDRDNTQLVSTFTIRTVVQLVRKQVVSTPSAWSTPQNYLIYQYNFGRSPEIQTPFRMEGNILFRGLLNFCDDYPRGSSPRTRYFADLGSMRSTSYGDHRPLSGTYTTSTFLLNSDTKDLFTGMSTTFVNSLSFATTPPVNHPGNITTYRLYPGGPTYSIPDLYGTYGATLTNVNLQPDMTANPLGIYRTSGSITLNSNTTLTGTLIAGNSGDTVRISGGGVQLNAYNLPSLNNSSTVRQLPALLVNGSVACSSGSSSAIKGMVMCYDRFQVDTQAARTTMALEGKMILNDLDVEGMSDWTKTDSWWNARYNSFTGQLNGSNPVPYFPVWLKTNYGVDYQSTLTVKPSATTVTYHWHAWDQPVYQAASADGGLRWNLISWQEGL